MLFIESNSFNPYFNIASEEFLLKNFNDDIIYIYLNSPSVIIGKHQNAFAEVDYLYLKKNNIDLVRRISGGGAVFHDEGNINFCIIKKIKDGHKTNDFNIYISAIINFLNNLGIEVNTDKRNNIFIKGKKISGNAEHVIKNKILHHGTLLYSSNLIQLKNSLFNKNKYFDKAIKSVKSDICNISDYLNHKININYFLKLFNDYLKKSFDTIDYQFSENDLLSIQNMINEKYSGWEWNFGFSPPYSFKNNFLLNDIPIEIEFFVEKGFIKNINIYPEQFINIKKNLLGLRHNYVEIIEALKKSDCFMSDSELENFISNLF
jgi:lipoate-protein ligase A